MLVTSASNPHLKAARQVRDGGDRDRIFVEGERLVRDCLSSGLEIERVFHAPVDELTPNVSRLIDTLKSRTVHVHPTDSRLLSSLSDTVSHQGLLVIARRPEVQAEAFWENLPQGGLVVALDRLQDPGNVGTLLRTCEAAGAHGVITLPGTADPWSPKALRASMGSAFRLPLLLRDPPERVLSAARARGFEPVATAVSGQSLPYRKYDWRAPTLLILGNEGSGVASELLAACPQTVHIPIHPSVESLNVATAAAVLLFEAAHCRGLPSR
jgi:TrmH family RNA methyltransferase